MKNTDIVSGLVAIVGSANVSTRFYDLITHGMDRAERTVPADKSKLPVAVVRPADVNEVSEILKLANDYLFPVYVRGEGTGIVGGCTPKEEGAVVLYLNRMNKMTIFKEDGYVEVEADAKTPELNDYLAPYGYHFPRFPGGWRVASIGGIVSINTSGHSVDVYTRKPGDYVMGLEIVLPTGEIIETGTRSWRPPAGPDLTRLFVGGEGLFGVITKIRIRLINKPLEESYALAIFKSSFQAARAAMQISYRGKAQPSMLEFMCEGLSKGAFERLGLTVPDGATLLIETDGHMPGEAQRRMKAILDIARDEEAQAIMTYEDPKEWAPIYAAREIIMRQLSGQYVATALDPPLSKVADAVNWTSDLIRRFASRYPIKGGYMMGHLGGVTIHAHMAFPTDTDDRVMERMAKDVVKELVDITLEYGATRGEQGNFPLYKQWFLANYGKVHYDILVGIKKMLDPNNILNRGNLDYDAGELARTP